MAKNKKKTVKEAGRFMVLTIDSYGPVKITIHFRFSSRKERELELTIEFIWSSQNHNTFQILIKKGERT